MAGYDGYKCGGPVMKQELFDVVDFRRDAGVPNRVGFADTAELEMVRKKLRPKNSRYNPYCGLK